MLAKLPTRTIMVPSTANMHQNAVMHTPKPCEQKQTTDKIPTPGTRGTSGRAGLAPDDHPETDGEPAETASTRA